MSIVSWAIVGCATDFGRSGAALGVSRNKNHPTAKEEKEQFSVLVIELPLIRIKASVQLIWKVKRVSRPSSHREHSNSGTYIPRRSSSHHHREASSSSTPSKKGKRKSKVIVPKNVDTIDKLDVTGLFGGSFHHDGPFDAVTRGGNKKKG
ncbi:CMF_collapsed_G0013050.mRNA.1.CDS.1 [Saccharomyces cerevisiae]|nr:CMF_collapsed_G0013050.mRNA.1.CDS.1 [Saccharomyces cerevisiae]